MDYSALLMVIPVLVIIACVLYAARSIIDGKNIVGSVIALSISIILLAVVIVPAIQGFNTSPGIDGDYQYDDYIEAPDAISANGAMELTTINSTKYLHCIGLGNATVTYSDDHTENYSVGKAKLDVFLLMGQSNAAYFIYDPATATPSPAMGTAYYYGDENGPIFYGQPSAPSYDTSFQSYSMRDMESNAGNAIGHLEIPFSAKYTEATGNKVYIINASMVGTSIQYFAPDQYTYNYCKKVFDHALDSVNPTYYSISVKSLIWIQGERDYNMSIDQYKSYFVDITESMINKEFNKDYSIKNFMISKTRVIDPTGTPSGVNAINSAEAQKELATEYSYIHLATDIADTFTVANGLMESDNLHYSQLGQNQIGTAIADYYLANIE